ncbi:MAG: hypothetical protein QT05_C0012G0011 [archaeon GW2011_AR13]|nr:MAG: hypothetical protein QT05_C0012G0011 [archaeon GW2011_AR13]HIG94045.1 hypothetical protein [Nanoarchaeota archaeon]HIH63763.1 hypothetical protein [Nanoarchaeota archaeon]HIJ09636.1 hypothetical protein [Nanoarchaeota archaeon]
MNTSQLEKAVKEAVKTGNWMISFDNGENSQRKDGFKWNPIGKWNIDPDWYPSGCEYIKDTRYIYEKGLTKFAGTLYGQGPIAGGYRTNGSRLLFCQTKGPQISIGGDEGNELVKVKEARILLVNEIPSGLETRFLNLRNHEGIKKIENLRTRQINLYGCTNLTDVSGLKAQEYAYLGKTTSLKSLKDLYTLNFIDLKGSSLESIEDITCPEIELNDCINLKKVKNLRNIQKIDFTNCTSLTEIDNLLLGRTNAFELPKYWIAFTNCKNLISAENLEADIITFKGCENLSYVDNIVGHRNIDFSDCPEIKTQKMNSINFNVHSRKALFDYEYGKMTYEEARELYDMRDEEKRKKFIEKISDRNKSLMEYLGY